MKVTLLLSLCFLFVSSARLTQVELPPLPYSYDALEPYMDAATVEVHYSKHHVGYTTKFNKALSDLKAALPDVRFASVEDLLQKLSTVPADLVGPLRNNGGGYLNHLLFWECMAPPKLESGATHGGGGEPTGALLSAITAKWGSFDAFRKEFATAGAGVFGSGWAWLYVPQGSSDLVIGTTPNQDTPVSDGATPVLVMDVWEHAYYLKYQNRRPEFIEAFFNLIDWEAAERRFAAALSRAGKSEL